MADKIQKQEVKEVVAYARSVHVSPRKARLVANIVKKLPVDEALQALEFVTKKAALPIKKLVNSAIANASHNFDTGRDRLYIKNLTVDGGRVFFRYKPRAQGRALPVRKRTSHINLVLGVADRPFAAGRKLKKVPEAQAVPSSPAETPEVSKVEEPKEARRSRFAFWKRKGQTAALSHAKEDTKGKKYTAFDRRSGS